MTEQEALAGREKYVNAFNKTMLQIWEEKLILLKVMDTATLLKSVDEEEPKHDSEYRSVGYEFQFLTYGLFQNWGTGREVPRGNTGDIGRPKVRVARRWFDRKYFASSMNIRDFFADSLGKEFLGVVSNAFSDSMLRQDITR